MTTTQEKIRIELSPKVYNQLKQLAEPFEDTPESVISKLIEHYHQQPQNLINKINSNDKIKVFKPLSPPDMKHTKILSVTIDNETRQAISWKELVVFVHEIALKLGIGKEKLQEISPSNIEDGIYESSGFHYIKSLDMSIQNVDAQKSWLNAYRLAKNLNKSIKILFQWSDKDNIKYRGKQGTFEELNSK